VKTRGRDNKKTGDLFCLTPEFWCTVKHCCKLRDSRAYREESGSVLVIGHNPIQEIACHTRIRTLFLAPNADECPGERLYISLCCVDIILLYHHVEMECSMKSASDGMTLHADNVKAARILRVTEPVLKKLSNLESVSGEMHTHSCNFYSYICNVCFLRS